MSDAPKMNDMGGFVTIEVPINAPLPYCTGERIKIYTHLDYPVLQTEIQYEDGRWSRFGSHFNIPAETLPRLIEALQQNFPHLFAPKKVKEDDSLT